jgi:O-antigen ligase
MVAGLVAMIAAVLLQLVPVPSTVARAVSPSSEVLAAEQSRVEQVASTVPGLGSVAGAAISIHPLSINPQATTRGLTFVVAFGLFFLGMTRALDAHEARRIVHGVLLLGVALALAGIAQKATATRMVYGLWQPFYAGDIFGPFVNKNHFAGWMVMAIPLSVGYFCERSSRSLSRVGASWRDRFIWLSSPEASQLVLMAFGILLMALSLVMTLSRSGIACFAVSMAGVGLVVAKQKAAHTRRALVVMFVVSIVAFSVAWAGIDPVLDRFGEAETLEHGGRLRIWLDTVHVIRQFPLVGSGLNTYATAMASYQTTNLQFSAVEAHNDYLQLAAEGGVLLVAAATGLLLLFVKEVRRRFCESVPGSADYWIRVGAATGLISIALQELVEFSLQMPGDAALFVVLCAVTVNSSSRV